MYDFSGIWFRIWGSAGIILLVGIICILFERKRRKYGYIVVAVAVCLSIIYFMRIISPSISTYDGKFVEQRRNSRIAPPLPFTSEYIFWNGEGKKKTVYLDSLSKRKIYPYDFMSGKSYKVYFDDFTNIIVKVIEVEGNPDE